MTAAPAEPLTFDPYDYHFHEDLEQALAEGGFDRIDDVAGNSRWT